MGFLGEDRTGKGIDCPTLLSVEELRALGPVEFGLRRSAKHDGSRGGAAFRCHEPQEEHARSNGLALFVTTVPIDGERTGGANAPLELGDSATLRVEQVECDATAEGNVADDVTALPVNVPRP